MNPTKLDFRLLTLADVPQLIDLLRWTHDREAKQHGDFPVFEDFESALDTQLRSLISHHGGWVSVARHRVCGFMIGIKIGELFGHNRGLVIPWQGWAVQGMSRKVMMTGLLRRLLHDAIQQGHTSIAWTMAAHDRLALQVARELGFGNRCADALRTTIVEQSKSDIRIERVSRDNLSIISALHQAHNRYYRQAPLWMPNPDEDPLEDLMAWMSRDDRWIWAAFDQNQPVGYLRTQAHAESYLSHHPRLRNITAAFVDPAHRQSGVATALLNRALRDLNDEGFKWCGVDYETINPSGSRFWASHFKPYTLSLTRRIDERITDVLES
jgi:ribosomal protein S18 acetylase RimI-like enzyme